MEYTAKSVIIGRHPREDKDDEYKTLIIRLYDVNEAHKQVDIFPMKEIILRNVEKVILEGKHPIYFLEGNDLIWPVIQHISIEQKAHKVFVDVR
ncbi:MAG: hypothetical protein ACMXYC_04485 [Candidatus Woesearchaeota archaeon]